MKRVSIILIALACLGVTTAALADVPTEMSVQGRLTNAGGAPVPAGLKNFTFKIFDLQVGGVEIWPGGPGETQVLTTDANGLWNAGVGTIIPLTEAVFLNPVRWLQVTVDDGVNPPETLPRIELRTNPYTYRAATSQQTDSIAGNSLGDLMDLFVDEQGDTMSGQLRVDVAQSGQGSNVEVQNIHNGIGPTWSNDVGVWGLTSDANSDDGIFNIGLGGAAQGENTVNYGTFGVARGAGSSNFALYGAAEGGATNVAGYFNGDLLVYNINGDLGTILPGDAVSSSEILDEPGIAVNTSVTALLGLGTAAMVDLITVTITTPADGYIVVDGDFYGWISGTAASSASGYAQIDEVAGGLHTIPYVRAWGELGPATDGNRFYPVSVSRTYFKSAGVYTFRLEVKAATVSGTGSVQAIYPTIRATFYPHAYGSVTTVMPVADAADFSQVRSVASNASAAAGGLPVVNEAMVETDLRELELKVARATAEAERAHRELLEAQIRATTNPKQTSGPTPLENNR